MCKKNLIGFIAVIVLALFLLSCEIRSEVQKLTDAAKDEKVTGEETKKDKGIVYKIVPVFPSNNMENIPKDGIELAWKVYVNGTSTEATNLVFQVCLSTTNPPKKVIKDPSGEDLFSRNKVHSGSLEPNKTYYWQVLAFDKERRLIESEVWTFKTQTQEIEKKRQNVILKSPENDSKNLSIRNINFAWEVEGIDSKDVTYELLISKSQDFSQPVFRTNPKTNNYLLTDKLEKSTNYFWKIIAKTDKGDVIESNTFKFSTISPTKPVFIAAEPNDKSSKIPVDQIKFKWQFSDNDGDILTYDYFLYEETKNETPLLSKLTLTGDNISVSKVFKYGANYFWKVKAKDEDGNIEESPIYRFTTITQEEAREIERLPKIVDISPKNKQQIGTEMKISWNYSKPLEEGLSAELLITQDINSTPTVIPLEKGTTVYKLDPGILQKGRSYYWKIRLKDEKGKVYENDWYSFFTQAPTVPTKPVIISPKNNAAVNPEKLTLMWERSTDTDGDKLIYDVFLGTNPSELVLIGSDLDQNRLEISSVERGKTYYWKVIVKDQDGNKIESETSKFNVKLLGDLYVLAPSNMAVNVPVKGIKFEWQKENLEDLTYTLRLGERKDKLSVLSPEQKENYFVLQTKLKYNTTYYWRVDRNYKGKSYEGEVYQFKTENLPSPSKLNPVGLNKSTKGLILSWNYPMLEVENISFDVYLWSDSEGEKKIAENIKEKSFVLPFRLQKEKTYYWKVVAKTDYGVYSESEIAEFKTIPQTIPSRPNVISPINNATNTDFENLILSWDGQDPDGDELKFLVYLDTTNPPQKRLGETKNNSYTVSKLLDDTTYYWQVVAIDEEHEISVGDVWSFTTLKILLLENFEKSSYSLQKVIEKGTRKEKFNDDRGNVLKLTARDGDSAEFSFELSIQTKFELKFEYLVSSEENCDFFRVYINDVEVYKDSGIKVWSTFKKRLEPGQYRIRFVYEKDRVKYDGEDCVLIDNLIIKKVE
ncbi:MAG: hypothetical protein N2252_01220 [Candidatus Kryptonium sp.]|nr:hypothetical protein [Candidatus Kryptonium sp.]